MAESPEEIAALQRQNCIFCKIISEEIPSKKVHEDSLCTAILDINPANEGHVIILPKEHYQIMPQVPKETLAHLAIISKKISKAILISAFGKSTSIFVANGAVAGQKAPHFMIHLIPRRSEKEFLVIPSKPASSSDLEAVKNIIAKKIEELTGKKLPERKIENPHEEIQEMKEFPNENIPTKEKIPETILNHPRKITKVGIKKEKGYLYFIDEDGDIARVPMKRGKGKKEKINKESEDADSNSSDENKSSPSLDDISKILLGGRK